MSAPTAPERTAAGSRLGTASARRLMLPGGRWRPAVRPIVQRRDLARLPEPRYLGVPPRALRWLATGMLALLAAFGAAGLAAASSGGLGSAMPLRTALAGLALAGGLGGLAVFRPQDWRSWIAFAAVPGGLYLPGRGRRVVFVPWLSVLDIADLPGRERSARRRVRLTLRLDRQNWARLSPWLDIEGADEVRSLALPGHGPESAEAASRIAALRPANSLLQAS